MTRGLTFLDTAWTGDISGSGAPVLPPSAPTANAPTGLGNGYFTANWSASSGATNYYLDVATDSGFSSFVVGCQNLSVGNVTSYAITALPATATYYYRLRASNAAGTSGNSNTQNAAITLTAPDPVSTFIITSVTDTTVSLSWSPADGATGYVYYKTDDYIFHTIGNVTSYTLTGLSPSTGYTASISGTNAAAPEGGSWSSISFETQAAGGVPNPPTMVGAAGVTATAATFNWTAPGDGTQTGYRLDVSTDPAFGSFLPGYSNLDVGNVGSATLTGLDAATTYYAQVRAYNLNGESANSNTWSLTPNLVVPTFTAVIGGLWVTTYTSTSGVSYSVLNWDYGDGNTSSGAYGGNHYASASTTYTITLTATDSNGNMSEPVTQNATTDATDIPAGGVRLYSAYSLASQGGALSITSDAGYGKLIGYDGTPGAVTANADSFSCSGVVTTPYFDIVPTDGSGNPSPSISNITANGFTIAKLYNNTQTGTSIDIVSTLLSALGGLNSGVPDNDMHLERNLLPAAALNYFFTAIGSIYNSATLFINGNPGSFTCNTSIATGNNWVVNGCLPVASAATNINNYPPQFDANWNTDYTPDYVLDVANDPAFIYGATLNTPVTGVTYTITPLTYDLPYYYRVRGVVSPGVYSDYSNTIYAYLDTFDLSANILSGILITNLRCDANAVVVDDSSLPAATGSRVMTFPPSPITWIDAAYSNYGSGAELDFTGGNPSSSTVPVTAPGPYTFIFVAFPNSTSVSCALASYDTGDVFYVFLSQNSIELISSADATDPNANQNTWLLDDTPTYATPAVYALACDNINSPQQSSVSAWINGHLLNLDTFSFNASANGYLSNTLIGGSSGANFDGKIYDVIVYEGILSDYDRGTIESYLATKWSITF